MWVSGGDAPAGDEEEGGHTGDKYHEVGRTRNSLVVFQFVEQVARESSDHTKDSELPDVENSLVVFQL